MFGKNKKEKSITSRDGRDLEVNSMFHTIQGEGPFAGERAFFIRLAGCNLACSWCDTEFEKRTLTPTGQILAEAELSTAPKGLIVITGGEPLRQNITPLCILLLARGYRVQIETAGTLWPPMLPVEHDNLTIVCCPKTPKVHHEIERHCNHWKYVIQAGEQDPETLLPKSCPTGAKGKPFVPKHAHRIYVMPCDEKHPTINQANIQAMVKAALTHGYRAGLQLHKYMEVE